MNKTLKKSIQEYYQSHRLSGEQLDQLREASGKGFVLRRYPVAVPALCGFLLALVGSFLFFSKEKAPLMDRITVEVVYNHNKNMPSEVLTSSYQELNEALDRLGFQVRESQRLKERYALVGGRYCSIQGKIAAQLKLRPRVGKDAQVYTLYQFKKGDMAGILHQAHHQSTRVEIWSEGEMGFALAVGSISH